MTRASALEAALALSEDERRILIAEISRTTPALVGRHGHRLTARRQTATRAAIACYVELGFTNATMPVLGKRAGVHHNNFNRFFGTRTELFELVCAYVFAEAKLFAVEPELLASTLARSLVLGSSEFSKELDALRMMSRSADQPVAIELMRLSIEGRFEATLKKKLRGPLAGARAALVLGIAAGFLVLRDQLQCSSLVQAKPAQLVELLERVFQSVIQPKPLAAPSDVSGEGARRRARKPVVLWEDLEMTARRLAMDKRRPASFEARREMLNAVTGLFVSRGYDAGSLDEIAVRRGSLALFYHRFGTKPEIFKRVCEVLFADVGAFDVEPESLARDFARELTSKQPAHPTTLDALLLVARSSASSKVGGDVRQYLEGRFEAMLSARLRGARASLRASLFLAISVGFQMMRRAIESSALVDAKEKDLAALLEAALSVVTSVP